MSAVCVFLPLAVGGGSATPDLESVMSIERRSKLRLTGWPIFLSLSLSVTVYVCVSLSSFGQDSLQERFL